MDSFFRPTWAEIDLDAIAYNLKQIKKELQIDSKIMAVVKADAYGHGAEAVAKTALEAGADALAVALLEEGIKLRKSGIQAEILVLGWVDPRYVKIAMENDITLTFFQLDWLKEVQKQELSGTLKVQLELDTGMGRTGIRTINELKLVLEVLNLNNCIYLTGVYTHFATADGEDLTYFEEQQARFNQMLEYFYSIWKKPVAIHTSNSAASIRNPKQLNHYIRFGVSMYGLFPSNVVKAEDKIQLKQAFSLYSRLISVKQLPAGESIGYGATYRTTANEWIGTVPIGYADGWIRKLQGMSVLINGKRMPIVGRICMDQFMVRLDQAYDVGEQVTLVGTQLGDTIDFDELADYLETINYEIPCIIGARVPRVYKGQIS